MSYVVSVWVLALVQSVKVSLVAKGNENGFSVAG